MSRATTKAKKLPAGLPPLPPVPEGWDAWEYMGMAWSSSGKPVGAPWSCADKVDKAFIIFPESWKAFGFPSGHYIRAIRREKPSAVKKAKSPDNCPRVVSGPGENGFMKAVNALLPAAAKPKPARKGRVVAKRRFMCEDERLWVTNMRDTSPVFVLPADAASVERMVEQGCEAVGHGFRQEVIAALAAIGIRAPGKGGGK